MPSLRYDGFTYEIDAAQLSSIRERILQTLKSGSTDWLELDFGENETTWLLVGPGIPFTLDEEDPPEMPEMPDLSSLGFGS